MQLSFGNLPEDHHFLLVIRPLTDWIFKFVGWLIIAATLSVGGEKTGNWYLLIAGGILSILPFAFIYGFLHWLSCVERPQKQVAIQPDLNRMGRIWNKTRQIAVLITSLVIWWGLVLAAQFAINQTVTAIMELQKSALR